MQARSEAKFIRIAPRKVRLLVNLIRGMQIQAARAQLKFSPKQSAEPILKALNSAVANAEHNLKADTKNFVVLQAFVNEGPKIKRYTPKAQGRATLVRKRTSHITIVVGDKEEAGATKASKSTPSTKPARKPVVKKPTTKKKAPVKKSAPKTAKKK